MNRFVLVCIFAVLFLVMAVQAEDASNWDKIGAKLSDFWDKTKDAVSEGAKTIGHHAEKFGKDAKDTAEKLFKNAKTEVGITPDKE